MNTFVHFDVKSDFTFWQGASKLDDLVDRAKELGMNALAITDTNNLFGAFDFSKKAKAKGLHPIIGVELFIGYSVRDDRRNKDVAKKGSILLLAQDDQGYRNLCALVSEATKPKGEGGLQDIIKPADLLARKDGVILLSGGQDGIFYSMLNDGLDRQSLELAAFFQQVFADRFYIQISRTANMSEAARKIEEKLLNIAFNQDLSLKLASGEHFQGVPLIASMPVRYAERDRQEAWGILRALNEGRRLQYIDGELTDALGTSHHMRSAEEVEEVFRDLPEAFENASTLAQRFAFLVEGRKPILPAFDTGANRNEAEELRHQSELGLADRLEKEGVTDPEEIARYRERLDFELKVIENMGFPGYFLIVADFMKWSRSQGIPVGPGRGSGAGSVVAWALTITDLNPFRFGLLFERFLNPDRVSMPDFDIDFCQDRREEVIRYVSEKYGVDHVAQIANFGEIKSKTAIKDAARVIMDEAGSFGFNEVNELTAMIPRKEDSADPKSLVEAYQTSGELAKKIDSSPRYQLLYKKAHLLEGLYRSQGMHAAGIVIADRPLHDLAPIGWDEESGLPVTQFNMKSAESVGLVKFDFLGLKTLSVIRMAIDLIDEFQGKKIDIEAVPFDDPEVYKMLAEGKSIGVFQFESAGMQRVLRQVQPTRIEDLIAVNALYRPGPMEMIPHYAACKRGEQQPSYPDPIDKTKPFLEETFGIMVYQEQVMQVAQVVAGYSLGQADLLRRAMGKKIKSEMDAQKEMFIAGAVKNGTSREAAEDLFHHIERFASYGFNKSHAAAYAVIAYRTAWLKRHYPVEFLSALMSYEAGKPEKMALIRDDMEVHPAGRIELLPPDVSKSWGSFRPERNKEHGYAIRFGLHAIKNVSGDLGYLIEEQQKKPFEDLIDFYKRAGHRMNKAQLEKLAEAGAFDALKPTRSHAHETLLWLSRNWDPDRARNDLFGDYQITIPDRIEEKPEWGDVSDREFNSVGFWFGKHPIDPYMSRLPRSPVRRRQSFKDYMLNKPLAQMENAKLCVLVDDVRVKESRRNTTYISLRVSEKKDSYFITFFTNRGQDIYDIFDRLDAAKRRRAPVIIDCKLAIDNGGDDIRIFGREVYDVDEFLEPYRGVFHVTMDASEILLNNEEYEEMKAASNEGERCAVYAKAMRRKLVDLNMLFEEARKDDDPSGTSVLVEVRVPGYRPTVKLKSGSYRITAAYENRLKSLDGLTSMREVDRKEVEAALSPAVTQEQETSGGQEIDHAAALQMS